MSSLQEAGCFGLPITVEHLRCWREDLYVRPVGKAFRVCVFEIYGFVLGSGQPRTDARLWVLAEIRLSGPNSVNAFVGCSYFSSSNLFAQLINSVGSNMEK